MQTIRIPCTLLGLLMIITGAAQEKLPLPLNIIQAIHKGTRTTTGVPGIHYWQNTADYHIQVRLDPASRMVSGTAQISYLNNSPDTLSHLLFKLYPNIYQKGAIRDIQVNPLDLTEGVSITHLMIGETGYTLTSIPRGTNLDISIDPLLPGQSRQVSLGFSYTLNENTHIRTGAIDSGAFFIAYFFPRIAVYDDIDGWNKYPYIGSQEFYNDFCHFSVAITVPDNYVVWATGDLKNKEEVFGQKYIDRIAGAETGNKIVSVIDSADLAAANITRHQAFNTWKFDADHVTDFAFAASNHYLWRSASVETDPVTRRRTRVDAVFNPSHKDYREVAGFARKTVDLMSFRFPNWPFPYAHETIFDGLDQMEYPMMVNDTTRDELSDIIPLTSHEIFHTMFPFYMGTNETKYGWMDEGWATIGEWLLTPLIDPGVTDDRQIPEYSENAGRETDLPVITLTTQLTGAAFLLNSYTKPALGYLYVKDMLGDAAFFKGLHNYIRQWNGKHPVPTDFFYAMNAGSGKNLNWFWKRWFYDDGYPDLAFGTVTKNGSMYQVVVESPGTKPVPVDLTVYFRDGSTREIHRDVSCWEKGNRRITLRFSSSKTPVSMEIGNVNVPDIDNANNRYIWKN
jgi:Peptidase family M1 domain